ncbi:MAG: TonB family protein [Deltaproteobacteria bacterium]|jgi:TonB family protein|nr:TonB family protein [Deltaproteobacteria bacterium]
MGQLLRTRQDDPKAALFGADRQRFTLFLTLALGLHLAAFHLWGSLGLTPYGAFDALEIPQESFLELALELAGPPDGPAPPEAGSPPPEAEAPPLEVPPDEAAPNEATPDEAAPDEPTPDEPPPLRPSANLLENTAPVTTPLRELPDNTVNLEDTAPEFKSYHTFVRSAVARHWILPPEARTNFKPGRFTAIMTISREGQILSIVVEESSNSSPLDFAAMEAMRGAAPYPPFPPELSEFSQLNFRLHFDYRAIQRRVGPDYRPQ